MPYETVQHARVATYDFEPTIEPTTELSVHWTKDSHDVQLRVQRHADYSIYRPASPFANDPTVVKPTTTDPIPVGSVKVKLAENGTFTSAVAIKTDSAVVDGLTRQPGKWMVVRRCTDSTPVLQPATVTEAEVAEWPIVSFGDGKPTAATIFTEPLDRAEINRLIRTLRKARDDAYGADA